ncbi:hypothetical protein [Cellulomonas endophytica]|uniref:hypothetical protein n=1 Tax=Cellulomonas endophytica TaxID=2494735 RepID=UPI0010134980|nr:hypothetical protein [Cellulomonas endophytica]
MTARHVRPITALAGSALLLVGALAASASAAPRGPGFSSARPITGLEVRLGEEGIPYGVLSVRVVCPKGDGEQYAVRASAAGYSNAGRYGDSTGEPVSCTGHPQTVRVPVQGWYWGNPCRLPAGTYAAEADLVRVLPDAPRWENWEVLSSTTRSLVRTAPSVGEPCDTWE